MSWEGMRRDWRAMAKPRAIEEGWDVYLIRPLGFLLVQLFRHTPLTPTTVSFLAVLAGWLATGLYFASASAGFAPRLAALGALALLLHSALESADGQLARLKSLFTPLGRLVDGFCDNPAFGAIYLAIVAAQHVRAPEHTTAVAVLAVAGAASHSLQASLVEYQRTLYLFCVHGKTDLLESRPERQREGRPPGASARHPRGAPPGLLSPAAPPAPLDRASRAAADRAAGKRPRRVRRDRPPLRAQPPPDARVVGPARLQLPQGGGRRRRLPAGRRGLLLVRARDRLVPRLRPRPQSRDGPADRGPGAGG